ncbi:hypothetical protein B9Z55_007623 [Caenorhabditis nigoni]|uniref:BTB domain-containing protein n=2 Tax=Caenorhabditis nigoni TaxID=1611254 RepID=A0A2G5VAM2_9PELO|nr:hypothetical protein B9Z55_007623 [Caenorhabditis nigoni]
MEIRFLQMTEKEFTLKYVFEDVGELRMWEEKDSPEEEHCGVDWSINIEKVKNHLSILLNADVTKDQSIFADYTMKIVSKDKSRTFLMSSSCVFEHQEEYQGCSNFIDWETLKNKYLDNGKLEVEVHVKVTEMCGFPEEFPREDLRSFGEDMKQFSDVILKINEHKFYVSKLYLSSHSPYFSTLFLGKVQESGKSEIELKGVDPQDFQCYLEVLHLENAIDGNTVQGILSVADKFDTPKVVKKCEEFLIKESKKRLKEKLELAGRYRLEELKKQCLDQIKSKEDILSVIPEDPMKMDHDVAVKLLQKSLDFN